MDNEVERWGVWTLYICKGGLDTVYEQLEYDTDTLSTVIYMTQSEGDYLQKQQKTNNKSIPTSQLTS